jgi:hypothetical protein
LNNTPLPHKKSGLDRCPNCQNHLSPGDNFCPQCGQENRDLQLPFWHLAAEAVEGLLHFDGKSFRTLRALVLHPGFLTNEFVAGKRASYVPPVRLYILISVLFFSLLSFTSSKSSHSRQTGSTDRSHAGTAEQSSTRMSFYSITSDELIGLTDVQVDSLLIARGIEQTPMKRYVARQIRNIASGGGAEFDHLLLKGVSYMMFVLIPIFALILYVLYRGKVVPYLDSLVFSIHFHCFVFLLLSLCVVLDKFFGSWPILAASVLVLPGYAVLSLLKVYQQRWPATILKACALGILHLTSIAACFFATALLSIVVF